MPDCDVVLTSNWSVDPLQYLTITSDGAVYANASFNAMTADTPVDLVIPSEINGIKVTTIANEGFRTCKSLTSITIPDTVTTIGDSAFLGCKSLISIDIPRSVTYIGAYAFDDCISLTSVTIPDGVTTIGIYAFRWCESLTSITIPNTVTKIDLYAFDCCTKLTAININKPQYSIPGAPWGAPTSATVNWLG